MHNTSHSTRISFIGSFTKCHVMSRKIEVPLQNFYLTTLYSTNQLKVSKKLKRRKD